MKQKIRIKHRHIMTAAQWARQRDNKIADDQSPDITNPKAPAPEYLVASTAQGTRLMSFLR